MFFLFVKCFISILFAVSFCSATDFYSLSAEDIFGNQIDFQSFQGKVVIIVNIPFECRFADSIYGDLEGLHAELGGLDTLKILVFMSDQFGGLYPPCDQKQVKHLLKLKKKLSYLPFQIFKKTDVIGLKSHPVFKYLVKKSKIKPDGNFYKYLIDHYGTVAEVFPPNMSVVGEAYDLIYKYVKLTLDDALGNMKNIINDLKEEEKDDNRKKKTRHQNDIKLDNKS